VLDRLDRVVPLNPDVPLFGSIANSGHPMQEPELWRLWSRALTQAKVRPRTPENLRHTFVSILLSRGAPLLLVAAQAGHTPTVMLAHYSKWLPTARATPAIPQPGATPAQPQAATILGVVPVSIRGKR
jgi:integrase